MTLPARDWVLDPRIATGSDAATGTGCELGASVGDNLARHRRRRGIDLDTVAERSGVPVDVLALLEAGQAVPSLRAMWAIATALEVPFAALLAPPGLDGASFRVVRSNRGRTIESTSKQVRSRALFPLGDPYAPEVYELVLGAGCYEKAGAHARNTFEHLTVVRGMLVVQTENQQARLGPGDALFFRADRPHSYRNPTSVETVAHLVMTYA
jgi:transcriptional regulator with XRE-family HTH domain